MMISHINLVIIQLLGTLSKDVSPKIVKPYKINKSTKIGTNFSASHRIIGGFPVEISSYPYNANYGDNCGGTIIGKKWILTAGHCNRKPFVRVGSSFKNQGIQINVKDVYHYYGQKKHLMDYDFAILELQNPLNYSNSIQPIKIGRYHDTEVGKIVTVTGWGSGANVAKKLRAIDIPIVHMDICQKVAKDNSDGPLTPRMFCAGYKEGGMDACQGDSGGPAAANGRVVGLVSFGYGCAAPNTYGVYSNVSEVRDWISRRIGMTLD